MKKQTKPGADWRQRWPHLKKTLRAFLLSIGLVIVFAMIGIFGGDALMSDLSQQPAEERAALAEVRYVEATATRAVVASPSPKASATVQPVETAAVQADAADGGVWVSPSGSRYHLTATCSGMKTAEALGLAEAEEKGYTPCKRCYPSP